MSAEETRETRYELRAANGTLVAIHERRDSPDGGKKFSWCLPDGTRGLKGLHTTDLPLFGVHLLSDRPADSVTICEGEKAAQALLSAGLLAVGTVCGASVTPSAETVRPLVGRTVRVWPDADEQGRVHMRRIASLLGQLNITPRWVEWKEAPPHGDAADFIDERGPGTALDQLLAAARPFDEMVEPGRAVLVCFADVTPKLVRWVWRGRIPVGKVTVLDGDPGLAKSLVSLDLAARVSTGRAMPDDTPSDLAGPRGVVLLSAEDDPEDTIRPRLDAAEADVGRVVLLARVKDQQAERAPTLADLDALEDAVRQTDAALVIIDPLMAHFPDQRDTHRDHDIRRALAPLASLAARASVAVLVIRHLNKSGGGNPLYRGGGSIGIIGAARSGLLVARDPDDPNRERRILAVTKSNLSAPPPALAYSVVEDRGAVRINWQGQTGHTAESLIAAQIPAEERSRLDEAAAFLTELLANSEIPASEVKAAAREAGITERTLERARDQAGVKTCRRGFGPGAVYVWTVHARQNPHVRQPAGHDEHGEHGRTGRASGDRFGDLVGTAQRLFNAQIIEDRRGGAEGPQ